MSDQTQAGTLSPDGQFVWNGAEWTPVTGWVWAPTDWTRPLQYAIGAYLLVVGAFEALSPFLFADTIRAAALRSLQSNSSIDKSQYDQLLSVSVTVSTVTLLVFAAVFGVLGVMTVLRRWSWLFYVDLVLLGLQGVFGTLGGVLGMATGSAAGGLQAIAGLAFSVIALALFVWGLVGRIQRGVWAGRRAPVTASLDAGAGSRLTQMSGDPPQA